MGACVCFRRSWGPQDDAADDDIRQALAPGVTLPKETAVQNSAAKESVEIVVGSEGKPSGEARAVSATAAPASGNAIAVPEASAVKRANDLFTEGGLLMTEIEGKEKNVRRLELDVKTGTLMWHVQKFLFIGVYEKVMLKEARIMSTGKLLKIGVVGRSDFYTFEACDEEEAASVCECLNSHVQSMKGEAGKGKGEGEGHDTEKAVA